MNYKKVIVFILILISNYINAQEKFDQDSCMQTSKKLIYLIKAKEYKNILKLFPEEITKNITTEVLKEHIDAGYEYIKKYGIPDDDDLIKKANMVPTEKGIDILYSIIFPFPTPKEKNTMPERMIEVGFLRQYSNSKIVSLNATEIILIKD